MNLSSRKKGLVYGALAFLFTFLFFIFSIVQLLKNPLYFRHILVFSLMGLITASVFFIFTSLKLKFANIFFLLGNLLGFLFIGLTFSPYDGWSSLGGLLGFFIIYLISLVVSLLSELIAFIVRKIRAKKIPPK